MIAVDSMFEERLGCPDKYLGVLRGHPGDPERPGHKAMARFIQRSDAFLATELAMFGKGVQRLMLRNIHYSYFASLKRLMLRNIHYSLIIIHYSLFILQVVGDGHG